MKKWPLKRVLKKYERQIQLSKIVQLDTGDSEEKESKSHVKKGTGTGRHFSRVAHLGKSRAWLHPDWLNSLLLCFLIADESDHAT